MVTKGEVYEEGINWEFGGEMYEEGINWEFGITYIHYYIYRR